MIEMMATIICLALTPFTFPLLGCTPQPEVNPSYTERSRTAPHYDLSRKSNVTIMICKGRDGRDGQSAHGKNGQTGAGGKGGNGRNGTASQEGKGDDGSSMAVDRRCSVKEDSAGKR